MNWKEKLEKRWGQPLKFGFQCETLSADIFRVTRQNISAQTLRRACGFIQSGTKMSENTKIILHHYIGSKSQVVSENLHESEINFLVPFIKDFFQIPLSSFEDFNYQNACAKIAQRLFEKPALLESLGPFLAKNPIAQIYFFERLPFIDGLAGHYADWLTVYAQEKTDEQAQFYSMALLCWGQKLSQQNWQKLNWKKTLPSEKKLKTWHPFLRARAAILGVWEAYENKDAELLQTRIQRCIEEHSEIYLTSKNQRYFPFYEWIMVEGLHLIEHFKESEYFAKLYFQYLKPSDLFPIEPGYHEAIRVFQYRNAVMLNDDKSIQKLKKEIQIENVIFLGKRYFRILYNLTQLNGPYLHSKRKKQIQQQLREDIAATGYTFFENNFSG
ncbi:MAG: hypothetical protein RL062_641 [Bacteroidota bacterium]